jgi:hypothetical protein
LKHKNVENNIVQETVSRIDWAHQRQLADAAAFLGLGIGIVECFNPNKQQ